MDVIYLGHVVEIQQNWVDEVRSFIAVCVDRHLGLFLIALAEQPFHPWYVHIARNQEECLEDDIYVQTNILAQPSSFRIMECIGMLSYTSKQDIVEGARTSKALYEEDKETIEEKLLGEVDITYYAKGEGPDDVPWDC
jgi:hypothetical protein